MAVESVFLHIMISLGILLFAAKLMAELFHKIKLPIVLGELLAGIIVGPFALGALPLVDGEPLVVLDETIRHIGEIAAVVILFIAGLKSLHASFLEVVLQHLPLGLWGSLYLSLWDIMHLQHLELKHCNQS